MHPCLSRIFLPLLILIAAAACRKDTRQARIERGEVSINIGAEPTSLDPGQITDLQGARALMQMMRGLTYLLPDGTPKPELAESWTVSPDGLVYTFKLREAHWTNGQRVTADDFVYSWRRVLNPALGSQYAYQLFYIKGARAYYTRPGGGATHSLNTTNETEGKSVPLSNPGGGSAGIGSTPAAPVPNEANPDSPGVESIGVRALAPDLLEVTLENPTAFFLQLVAHQTYYPVCAAVDQENPQWFHSPETYVSNGPFKLVEHRPNYRIVVEKNPDYWNAASVKMNRIIFRMIEIESTELIAYENGEIDGTQVVPSQDTDRLKSRPDFHQRDQTATYFINLNTRRPPLDDVRVRRALAMAIDREALIANVLRQGQRPALSLSPPELFKGNPPRATFKDKDFEEARRLLAEAGFPPNKPPETINYLYNTMDMHRMIAETLQETWKRELGIELRLENQEWKVVVDRRHSGDYDITRAGWHADFPDAINFLEMYDSNSENNDPKFFDPAYDAMLANIRAEVDPAHRIQLMKEAEEYLMEQMPIIPVYYYTLNYMRAPELKGYELNVLGLFDSVDLEWVAAPASP